MTAFREELVETNSKEGHKQQPQQLPSAAIATHEQDSSPLDSYSNDEVKIDSSGDHDHSNDNNVSSHDDEIEETVYPPLITKIAVGIGLSLTVFLVLRQMG